MKAEIKISIKSKLFNAYISSIFLYNSETWTVTKTLNKQIDSFQRRLLRTFVLNIKWPTIVKNENVYEITKCVPWSKSIVNRKLKWFGKVARMPTHMPAKIALNYATQKYQKPPGRPPLTWIANMKAILKDELSISWDEALIAALDEKDWHNRITR